MDDGSAQKLDRRQFWMGASAWALLAASQRETAGASASSSWSGTDGSSASGILGLRLLTSTPLEAVRDFYHGVLGLQVLEQQAGELTIGAGSTRLTFVKVDPGLGAPFYHFAFNIPENKILAARDWQKERMPLIPPPEDLRDSRYPDDVVDYSHWNAHSIFFWDPAGNLGEYIARHDLENSAPGPFGPADILYASEIALVVDDVRATASELRRAFDLNQYRGGSDAFTALGDEQGLLLVMKRGRMLGFGEAKPADCFPTIASIRGVQPSRYRVPDFPYEISAE